MDPISLTKIGRIASDTPTVGNIRDNASRIAAAFPSMQTPGIDSESAVQNGDAVKKGIGFDITQTKLHQVVYKVASGALHLISSLLKTIFRILDKAMQFVHSKKTYDAICGLKDKIVNSSIGQSLANLVQSIKQWLKNNEKTLANLALIGLAIGFIVHFKDKVKELFGSLLVAVGAAIVMNLKMKAKEAVVDTISDSVNATKEPSRA